jgi:hypothetical protein
MFCSGAESLRATVRKKETGFAYIGDEGCRVKP